MDNLKKNIWDPLNTYFINYDIIINDNYDNYDKYDKYDKNNSYSNKLEIFKLYLLKYKRVIGLVLLIILLIIGYHCNPYSNMKFSSDMRNDMKSDMKIGGGRVGDFMTSQRAKAEMSASSLRDSTKATLAPVGKTLKTAVSPSKMFDAAGAAANKFSDNADMIYRILYSIAIFIVMCIVIVPSLAFIIIGVMCYFLLKKRMKSIKSL